MKQRPLLKQYRKTNAAQALLALMLLSIACLQPSVAADPESSIEPSQLADQAVGVQAELIWVEFDGMYHLLRHSKLEAEQWSPPSTIYSTLNPITTPTLAQLNSDSDTADFAVWTEQFKTKTVLMQSRRIEKERWQPATQFYSGGVDNFSPSVINDLEGNTWIFWSATQPQGLSDIVYSTRQDGASTEGNIASGWSDPKTVHPLNEVPDLVPQAALDRSGNIEVRWNTYDAGAQNYVETRVTLEPTTTSSAQRNFDLDPNYVDPIQLDTLAVPDFVPTKGFSFTLFSPLNKLERAVVRQ